MAGHITSPEDIKTKEHSDGISQRKFGVYQNVNHKTEQEDAFTFKSLDTNSNLTQLTPHEIGQYLWTSYKEINEGIRQEAENGTIQYANITGTTANSTVYDGKRNLISANLADSAAFAVIYDKENTIVGVKRLNSILHNASVPEEQERVASIPGATIEQYNNVTKLNGSLSITRALGDFDYLDKGLSSDAQIDIHNIDDLAREYQLTPENLGKIQIISVSDGYTEPTKSNDQAVQEQYLKQAIEALPHDDMDEKNLAQQLAKQVLDNKSCSDNITVLVTTITQDSPAFLQGVYDGHGKASIAQYTAQNICDVFEKMCTLSPEDYKTQKNSIYKNIENYSRDNDPATYQELKNIDSQIKQVHERALILEQGDQPAFRILRNAHDLLKEKKSDYLQGKINLQQAVNQCNSIVDTVNSNKEVKEQSYNLFFEEFDKHLKNIDSKRENLKSRGESKAAEVIYDMHNKLSIEKKYYIEGLRDSEQFSANCQAIINYAHNHQAVREHRNIFSKIFEGIKSLINKLVPGLCESKPTNTVEKVQSVKDAIQNMKNSTLNPQAPAVDHHAAADEVNEEQAKFTP